MTLTSLVAVVWLIISGNAVKQEVCVTQQAALVRIIVIREHSVHLETANTVIETMCVAVAVPPVQFMNVVENVRMTRLGVRKTQHPS